MDWLMTSSPWPEFPQLQMWILITLRIRGYCEHPTRGSGGAQSAWRLAHAAVVAAPGLLWFSVCGPLASLHEAALTPLCHLDTQNLVVRVGLRYPSSMLFSRSWCPARTWPGRCRMCPVTTAWLLGLTHSRPLFSLTGWKLLRARPASPEMTS